MKEGTVGNCPLINRRTEYLFFALLVCNRAGSLAGGLAGCLALAAAALGSRLFQAGLVKCFDMFHILLPPKIIQIFDLVLFCEAIIPCYPVIFNLFDLFHPFFHIYGQYTAANTENNH